MYQKYKDMSFPEKLFELSFSEIIGYIDENYAHTPTAFKNGELMNEAHENQGSARTFYFARLHMLSESDTLRLFAEHYESVLKDVSGNSHQNIRSFMKYGWQGVEFYGTVLESR